MKLRIGLIGLGKDWDTRHGPALRSLSEQPAGVGVGAGVTPADGAGLTATGGAVPLPPPPPHEASMATRLSRAGRRRTRMT